MSFSRVRPPHPRPLSPKAGRGRVEAGVPRMPDEHREAGDGRREREAVPGRMLVGKHPEAERRPQPAVHRQQQAPGRRLEPIGKAGPQRQQGRQRPRQQARPELRGEHHRVEQREVALVVRRQEPRQRLLHHHREERRRRRPTDRQHDPAHRQKHRDRQRQQVRPTNQLTEPAPAGEIRHREEVEELRSGPLRQEPGRDAQQGRQPPARIGIVDGAEQTEYRCRDPEDLHHVDLGRHRFVEPEERHRQHQPRRQPGPTTETSAEVAGEREDRERGRDRGRQSSRELVDLAERQTAEDDGDVEAGGFREVRLSEEPRHDPVAAVEHGPSDEAAQPFGPPELAATEADEEQQPADGEQEPIVARPQRRWRRVGRGHVGRLLRVHANGR